MGNSHYFKTNHIIKINEKKPKHFKMDWVYPVSKLRTWCALLPASLPAFCLCNCHVQRWKKKISVCTFHPVLYIIYSSHLVCFVSEDHATALYQFLFYVAASFWSYTVWQWESSKAGWKPADVQWQPCAWPWGKIRGDQTGKGTIFFDYVTSSTANTQKWQVDEFSFSVQLCLLCYNSPVS